MEYWLILLVLYLCIFLPILQRTKQIVQKRSKLRKRGVIQMNEIIEKYINKNVSIQQWQNTFAVQGVITEVKDNWIELTDKKGKKSVINADYISMIQEIVKKPNKNK